MNCPKASFEGFTLWCCPEGTYAARGGRLLSFSKNPHPECAPPVATMTEDTGESSVGLWVSLTMSVLLTIFVFLCCRACRKQQQEFKVEEEREIQREEKREWPIKEKKKKKKSVGSRAKKEFERKQKERKMKKKN